MATPRIREPGVRSRIVKPHIRSLVARPRRVSIAALGAIALAGCVPSGEEEGTRIDAVHRVCPGGNTSVRGVDVSIYQGTIDWPAAARGGVRFTIIRHSHGSTTDTNFRRNWTGSAAAGILHGAYQYFDPWGDPTAQANAIADGLEAVGFGPGDLPPTLDVEQPRGSGDPPLPTPAQYTAKVTTWMNVIRRRLGVEGFIYTGGYYWDQFVQSNSLNSHPLWHAQYFNYPGTIYNLNVTPLPGGGCPTSISNAWPDWVFWQFAGGNGRAPGFSGAVDLDVFNGTMAELRALAVPTPVADAGTDAARPDASRPDVATPDANGSDVVASDVTATDAVSTDVAEVDASNDAPTDANSERDAAIVDGATADGSMPGTMPAGCGCRTATRSTNGRSGTAVVFIALAFVTRRRRALRSQRSARPPAP